MTDIKESKVQSDIINYLRSQGYYVYKNAASAYTEPGRPDLVACVAGYFVGLEIKRPGKLKNLSEAQKIVARKINDAGGIWRVVDNLEDVKELIEWIRRVYR